MRTEFDHNGVGVSVDNLGIVSVTIGNGVAPFDFLFGAFNHLTAVRSRTGRDGKTWQFAVVAPVRPYTELAEIFNAS